MAGQVLTDNSRALILNPMHNVRTRSVRRGPKKTLFLRFLPAASSSPLRFFAAWIPCKGVSSHVHTRCQLWERYLTKQSALSVRHTKVVCVFAAPRKFWVPLPPTAADGIGLLPGCQP